MLWCAIEYYCFYLLLYKKKGIKNAQLDFLFNIEGEKKMPQNNKNDSLVTWCFSSISTGMGLRRYFASDPLLGDYGMTLIK